MTIRGHSARRVWFLLGLLCLVGVLVLLGGVYLRLGWAAAASVANVVSIPLVVVELAVGLIAWSRSWSSSRQAGLTGEQVAQAREVLAAQVREQGRREAEARLLGDPKPMPVRWTLTERAIMDHPQLVITSPGFVGRSDAMDSLVREFDRLPRRRLVILGPAGAGKTTLAVQLLLELLATRTPEKPVPVLLSLASWDTTTAPRLQDWLTDRLTQDYPALRAVGLAAPRALVEQGFVLPILDGLDELPDHYRPTVISAINSSLGATDPLVLICHTDAYVDAVAVSDVLTAAAVIESQPLSCSEAAGYLVTCLPPEPGGSWREVLAALNEGDASALAEVCATPLGLWLVRVIYIAGRVDPTPLLSCANATTLRIGLLDQLIPAVIAARPPNRDSDDPLRPRRSWDPEDMRRWLGLLARQLDSGTRDLLWWHLGAVK